MLLEKTAVTNCVTERKHIDKENLITGRRAVWKQSVAHTHIRV